MVAAQETLSGVKQRIQAIADKEDATTVERAQVALDYAVGSALLSSRPPITVLLGGCR